MASSKKNQRRAPATRRKVRAPVRKAGAAARGMADTVEQLRQLKLNHQAIREKLMLVSPDLLSNAEHEAWADQIFQVSLAINGLRNAALENLSAEFTAELPNFESATTQLVDDLFELQQAVDVIKAVAGVLDVIRQVARLLA